MSSTFVAEPLQEWLDSLPRDDLCHVVLLLYTNPPRKFCGIRRLKLLLLPTLYRSERTVSSRTHSKVTMVMQCMCVHVRYISILCVKVMDTSANYCICW